MNSFTDFIGQEKAKTVIQTLIKASKIRDQAVDHIFCCGVSGTGKSSLARLTAKEIGSNFYSLNCSTVTDFSQLYTIIKNLKRKDILFLDETHSLPKKCSESLYTIMENFFFYDKKGNTRKVQEFTVIGASTDFGLLPDPLKNRFKFIANFEEYSEEELIKICHSVCLSRGFTLNEELAAIISKTCRGTPRHVVSRTDWIYQYMIANDLKKISSTKVLDIISLQGYNEDGLDSRDLVYLNTLYNNGTISLSQLSFKSNISKNDLIFSIEPFLIKIGLVEITNIGRSLTYKGHEYVESIRNRIN